MALFRHPYLSSRIAALTVGAASVVGCLDRPLEVNEPNITSTVYERLPKSRIDKIDLLLMIDNSSSMADKQAILADAVPDLVKGLVSPLCIDEQGKALPQASQPTDPSAMCPLGSEREFDPVPDIHIGIISSSLGGYGNPKTCPVSGPTGNPSNNDQAHLLSRKDATLPPGGTNVIDTYQNKGFLAWDLNQKLTPPGTNQVGDTMGHPGLVPTLRDMVNGVGQVGCGFEAQLESWYRFLVDPEPPASIEVENGKAVLKDVDQVLLSQRAEFLRPDSLVAVVMLTDENDCSFVEGGAKYVFADQTKRFPGEAPGEAPNLRCFRPKERFGVDFLYPVDRYVQAIQNEKIANRAGDLVDNPLYPKSSGDPNARTPDLGLVFVAGIVGVPWQDIARKDAHGKPDLVGGLDGDRKAVGGFMTAAELSKKDAAGNTVWDQILGDPANNKDPLDSLMIESEKARGGMTPATGDVLAPASATSPTANPINGHEWNPVGDLQYACTFKLPNSQPGACSTDDDAQLNPLCQDEATGQYGDTRYGAKGYPGVRELSVLKGIGNQGIVASVCPADLNDAASKAYGYRPAIGAIIDQLKSKLSGQCLHRSLTPDTKHQVSCLVLEGRKTDPGQCSCDAPAVLARQDVQTEHLGAKQEALADPIAKAAGWNCFCEIKQAEGDALTACQNDTHRDPLTSGGQAADGWCYIDATTMPTTGNPALVDNCAATEKRKIRFVGAGQQLPNSTLFMTCAGN